MIAQRLLKKCVRQGLTGSENVSTLNSEIVSSRSLTIWIWHVTNVLSMIRHDKEIRIVADSHRKVHLDVLHGDQSGRSQPVVVTQKGGMRGFGTE